MASSNFTEALSVVSSVSDMSQATKLFQAFGLELAVITLVPVVFMLILGGVVEGGRSRKLWDYKGYWILLVLLLIAELLMLVIFPVLVTNL